MSFNMGNITATLSLVTSQFMSALNSASRAAAAASRQMASAFNATGSGMGNMNSNLTQMNSHMKDMSRIVGGIMLSQAFYQGANAIKQAGTALGTFLGDMEKAQIALTYFTGSQQSARGFLMNMQDFAAETPYTTQQSVQLSRRIMAAGFKPENVRSIMTTLADAGAASGGTSEELDRIVLALTQIQTRGKVAGQEVMQLANAGIPIYQILQEKLGLSAKQLSDIGRFNIPADKAITAILQGLNDRYAGASKKLAETVPAMMETIKDDMLIAGSEMFSQPFGAMGNIIRSIRDTMDKVRTTVVKSGIGGVFEMLIPKSLQQPLRVIIGSFESMASSVATLGKAMMPVAKLFSDTLGSVLYAVLPPMAAIVKGIADLALYATSTSPVVRVLITSIAGLVVANTATRALMFLWQVTRMGVVCEVVAGAVMTLARAINVLFVAFARNPLTGVIMAAAAALLYLAMSSQRATAWLDALYSRIGQLAGTDFSKILQPTMGDDFSKWTDQYNQQLSTINDNLGDVGKTMDDNKKKAEKMKDVMSFDEVYRLQDQKGASLDPSAYGAGAGGMKFPTPGNIDWGMPGGMNDKGGIGDKPYGPPWLKNFDWSQFIPSIPGRVPPEPPEPPSPGKGTKPSDLPSGASGEAFSYGSKNIGNITGGNVAAAVEVAIAALDKLKQAWDTTIQGIEAPWVAVWNRVSSVAAPILSSVSSLISTTINGIISELNDSGISSTWNTIWTTVGTFSATAWDGLKTAWDAFATGFTNGMNTYGEGWNSIWGTTWNTISSLASSAWQGLSSAWDSFGNSFSGAMDSFGNAWGNIWDSLWNGIKDTASSAWAWLVDMWENHKTAVLATIGGLILGAVLAFTGLPGAVMAAIADLLPEIVTFFEGMLPRITTVVQDIPSIFSEWVGQLPGIARGFVDDIVAAFEELITPVTRVFSNVWSKAKGLWQSIKEAFSGSNAPVTGGNGNVVPFRPNPSSEAPVDDWWINGAAATGGIINREGIIRVGERNKREVVVPLQNDSAMAPFASAVANQLSGMMGTGGSQPIMYVGNLIADDRSLRELERRMRVIRLNENLRTGG